MHFVAVRNKNGYAIMYGFKKVITVDYPDRDTIIHALITSGFVDKRYASDIVIEIE